MPDLMAALERSLADATGKSGEKIVGTVKCDGFTVPNPVAG